MNKKDLIGLLGFPIGFIVGLILFLGLYWLLNQIFFSGPPQYYIQDTWYWCCNNLNQTLSPYGDNCSVVINEIYGGCY